MKIAPFVTSTLALATSVLVSASNHNIRVTSGNPELNGKLLSVSDGAAGVHDAIVPLNVFVTSSDMDLVKMKMLWVWPTGELLALDGARGLQPLIETTPGGRGQSLDAASFLFEGRDITDNHPGSWVAMPKLGGGWSVFWYDGESIITQNYFAVHLTAELASSPPMHTDRA
ncbi:hypothetical protein Micbo1qcDRAFT_199950 [Microdochium bolleyi]|uniref:Uncharacterized protein n=1 Tax=Microdochium bolleyi TaxID=196109 RepID=A0A136JJA6_9PEZI|nr:hypothetical protein Micbo1qcDRAFT_199950 [Microdochium bolleyi]